MDPMQTQLNIRNNVRDMQSHVKDLYAWEEDIKSKDENANRVKNIPTRKYGVPAVRGRAAPVAREAEPDLMRPAAQLAQGESPLPALIRYSA